MKVLTILLGAACAIAASGPASAQKVDLSTIKCGEFIKQDKDFHGQILMFLSGYSMDEDDDPIVNFETVIANGQALGKYCAENPDSGLITAWNKVSK